VTVSAVGLGEYGKLRNTSLPGNRKGYFSNTSLDLLLWHWYSRCANERQKEWKVKERKKDGCREGWMKERNKQTKKERMNDSTLWRIELFFDSLVMIRIMESCKRSFPLDKELIELVGHWNVSHTTPEAGMWMVLTVSNSRHFLDCPPPPSVLCFSYRKPHNRHFYILHPNSDISHIHQSKGQSNYWIINSSYRRH